MTPAEVRLDLHHGGYCPLPLIGKRPVFDDWPKRTDVTELDIEMWSRTAPAADNTGILTKFTPTFDIDIFSDEEAATAVADLARDRFEDRGYFLVRAGNWPKRAIPFRTDTTFPKISRILLAANGKEEKLEFLCDGQQVVVHGIHPDTHRPYDWLAGDAPGKILRQDLPYIHDYEAQALVDDAAALLVRDFGYRLKGKPPPPPGGQGDGAADWARYLDNLEDHDALAAFAMALLRSGMGDGAAVNFLREAVRSLRDVDEDRRRRRLDEIPGMVSSAQAKIEQERSEDEPHEGDEAPLPYVDLTLPLKAREWLVHERIPMFNVTIVSGEGAVGKSTLLMQLAGSTVLGKGWIGMIPARGPALYLSCEEDGDEVRRRLEAVAADLGSTRQQMIESGLHALSLAGLDAILGEPDKKAIIRPTRLFLRIRADAQKLRPKLIVIDTTADAFGGDEVKRGQARQFITLLRGLAIAAGAAVVLAAHPSLAGIQTDSGLSGSTGWHNSVRARAYFKAGPGEDATLRALEFRKNNYGPPDAPPIVLRWQNGVYVVAPGDGTFEELAAQAEVDQLFLTLLRRFEEQGRNVSDKPSTTYAPVVFLNEPDAKAAKATRRKLTEAMARLFAAGKIRVVTFGPPARQRSRISENSPSNAKIIPFQRPSNAQTPLPTPFQPPLQRGSNPPSNGVPTRLDEGCSNPPIPPVPLEGANGAVLRDRPAPTNGDAPPAGSTPPAPYEVLGLAPGERCSLCGSGGGVQRIRRGGEVNTWHEACAAKYVAAVADPTPAAEQDGSGEGPQKGGG